MTDILYGTRASLFTGKARAYLDWKGIDYREIPPDAKIREEVILPAVGRMVIPVMQLSDGTILQDTSVIIDHYEAAIDGPSVYPSTPRQKFAAMLLETYGDEWLVIPAMHYRWNYNEGWIYGEFGKSFLPDASAEQQEAAGRMVGERFKGFVPMLGINDASIPAIEASYEALLTDLNSHFERHDFLLGSRPSIGDYGLIGPMYAHLYRDPESGKVMKRLAPRVADWVERMVEPTAKQSGEFLGDDEIPDTLVPVLQRMMQEQIPNLLETAQLMTEWGKSSGERELPRAVGQAGYWVEGHASARFASTFSLWMLQRATDYLATLQGEDRAACEALLREAGGETLLDFPMPFRLEFKDHRLWRA
ncbi:MAG: glutathione S-transferase [Altererythrobacter sp.]|nr:glutathione S-transferase [Altererythrobacter sp.]NNF94376.1 glutathione S-transferase [Altererythrobacter sp.]NNK46810.1 glutathione S-transferase [Altererythrobacter sp.]